MKTNKKLVISFCKIVFGCSITHLFLLSNINPKSIVSKPFYKNFDTIFLKKKKMLISTMAYSILVNGEPMGDIRPSRGLRQGDPLSPYLFLLCSEGLNRMLQRVISDNCIRSFSLCKRGPKISLFFCKW